MKPPPISQYLNSINTVHHVFEHDHPIESLEQAAVDRNLNPNQIIRSILFRIEEGKYVLVCVSGPGKVDWKSLRKHLGVSRIITASPEDVLETTGYQIGSLGPFGFRSDIPILVDQHILEHDVISFGSGKKHSAIIMETKEFIHHLSDYRLIDFH